MKPILIVVLSLGLAGSALAEKEKKAEAKPQETKCEARCIDWNQKREWKKRDDRKTSGPRSPMQMLREMMDRLRVALEEAE